MGYRKTTKENTKHLSDREFAKKVRFRLKKRVGDNGKGKIFDPVGGIVSGANFKIDGQDDLPLLGRKCKLINFTDKEYFEPVINVDTKKEKSDKFLSELSKLTKKHGIQVESVGELFLTDDNGELGSVNFD
ncbi:MAG: hypothetical protein SLAVMIC_00080 [uncultured marine phage]|uniref:Uncharacterized protein n=1 Tax=uncultured marine phage TaxID=707152 RepID=A0A8D9C8A8_9VIRU|nr:MAG: hypothetical protein SLAVMIC_00080 [uncultured marine phage]